MLDITREEERMLSGDYGEWTARAMRLIIKLGELNAADRLVEISRVHLSGVSYKTVGDAAIELLRDMVSDGVKLKAYTTLNPAGMDFSRWKIMRVPEEFAMKQKEIVDLYQALGAKPTLTCAPYLYENKPDRGEIVAFAESSAVIYANSIIGARTNRHGSIDALAAAIAGRVPLMGLLLKENRFGNIVIDVNNEKFEQSDYGLLGLFLGDKLAPTDIPVFIFKHTPTIWDLRSLGAALAASGAIAMFHTVGITPEAKTMNEALGGGCPKEKIIVDMRDVRSVIDKYFSSIEEPDAVFIGCPHASLDEIRKIGKLLHGKRIKNNIDFWVFTSRTVFNLIRSDPIYDIIKRAGIKIFTDTCMVVTPIEEMGIRYVWTDGSKAAWYIPKFAERKIKVEVKSIKEIVNKVTE